MKARIRKIIAAFIGLVTVVSATRGVADITSSLVLHLNFDETSGTTAQDSSGRGNNASLVNFPASAMWVPGRVGRALEFNAPDSGDDDGVITDGPITFDNQDSFTFAFWAKLKPYGTMYNPRLISPLNLTHWILWKPGSGVGLWSEVPRTLEPLESLWRHFTVTFDRVAGRYSVYVNGVKMASNGVTIKDAPGAVQWIIGHHENPDSSFPDVGGGDNFRGLLDDVRVYNRILTDADVQELYASAPALAPTVVRQPQSATLFRGDKLNLTVLAEGSWPLGYQWKKNGTDVANATNDTFTIPKVQVDDSGAYTVFVKNATGNATSDTANILVQPSSGLTNGLIAYWTFDEASGTKAADSSGRNNQASLINFPGGNAMWQAGRVGRALEFNAPDSGDDDEVLTDNPITFDNQNTFSFVFWAKPKPYGTIYNPRIISPANVTHWVLWKPGAGVGLWSEIPRTLEPTAGIWRHFAVTFDRTTGLYDVFVNGVQMATNGVTSKTAPGEVQWIIGHHETPESSFGEIGGGDNFRGLIDDLHVYNRIVSEDTIREIFSAAPPLTPTVVVQPQGGLRYVTEQVKLSVGVDGSEPLSYQWKKGTADVPGGTNATLVLNGLQTSDAGSYTVVVTNSVGTATSEPAVIQVLDPAPDLATGLILHLKFDETTGLTAADASGKNNPGTLQAFPEPLTNWVSGLLGGALAFAGNSGENEAVLVNDPGMFDFSATRTFSLAAWVRGGSGQEDGAGIICKGTGGGGEQYCVDVYSTGYRFYGWTGATPNAAIVAQSAVPPNGAWQLVVAVLDQANGRMKLYVDGVEAAESQPSATLASTTEPVSIGSREFQGGYTLNFNGAIDDVRIYQRVLTPKEITALLGPGQPAQLSYSRQGNTVTISWSASAQGYTLESAGSLPAANWTAVPNVANNSVTITATDREQYYRLKK